MARIQEAALKIIQFFFNTKHFARKNKNKKTNKTE